MKKEKICGYLDKDKIFHKSEYSFNQANIRIEMREINREISRLKSDIFKAFAERMIYKDRISNREHIPNLNFIPNLSFIAIVEDIYSAIFDYQFQEIVVLKERIRAIEKTYENRKKYLTKSPILRKDWWNDRYTGFKSCFMSEEDSETKK